jgi:signal peptidase I
MPAPAPTSSATPAPDQATSVKETVISVIIAFALAFVFRGFVIEAFLIPTGSMAPTLRGANMQFKSPQSGLEWAVTPWHGADLQNPDSVQKQILVHDPMSVPDPDQIQSGLSIGPADVARSWGDRIFVMKYLYSIFDPQRFDVVVFKNPRDPSINYIKRLLGLPNQMIALIDGDVFCREIQDGDLDAQGQPKDPDPWALPGWRVARKPERAQRAMWQEIFSSDFAPLQPVRSSRRWFYTPWRATAASSKDWQIEDRPDYAYAGSGPTALEWDTEKHPIVDTYPYNEIWNVQRGVPIRGQIGPYPVSDLRLSLGIRPSAAGQTVSAIVTARGHEFRGDIEGSTVTLRMRPVDDKGNAAGEWKQLDRQTLAAGLTPGKVTNIEFWHSDQSLKLFVDDQRVASGEYDWTPEERLIHSTGLTLAEVMKTPTALIEEGGASVHLPGRPDRRVYSRPTVRFEFSGGPFTIYRVALARDIYYQPNLYPPTNDSPGNPPHSRANMPALGTHPTNTVILDKDEFFVCGDNSPASLDARLWDAPSPWVAELDPKTGVVNRDLVIGKAFFVYFPAPKRRGNLPIPDFGSMRFIW